MYIKMKNLIFIIMILLLVIIPFRVAATVYLNVNPNQVNGIASSITALNVGQTSTLLNSNVTVQHTDDTQGNIHHLMRCGNNGLSFANGYVVNLGNPDYRIQLFLDNQWKQHCNTGSTAPNFYGPYYDSNQSKNVSVRLVLQRFQDTGSTANLTLPDYMTFCFANAEDGQNSSDCWYTNTNDQYYRWRTTSGSRTVTIIPNDQFDYGDAPDDGTNSTFHTLAANNGAMHDFTDSNAIYIGTIAPDHDSGTFQDINSSQDNINGTNDEDAVGVLNFDSSNSIFTVNISCNDNVSGTDLGAIVHGWIDFNSNNQFEVDEYTFRECVDTDPANEGSALLRWIDINNVQDGQSYLRLRITNQALPTDDLSTTWDERATGMVVGGEIEDHLITFSQASDFSDAPNSYSTLKASGGAEHGLGSNRYTIMLGNKSPDADSDGFSDGTEDFPNTATDDDMTDTSGIASGNDEDGVTGMPGFFLDSTQYSVDVICNDHDGINDVGAKVYGWVDFDNNGTFDVANNEFAEADCHDIDALSAGSATLLFSGFTVTNNPNTTFARLRITTQQLTAADFNGFSADGEVEDYSVIVGFRISGKVFTDGGTDTSLGNSLAFYNGILNGAEAGISNVAVTLYDETTNTCQSTITDNNGDYSLAALNGHSYTIYETANEVTPAPMVCPPQIGTVNADGLLENNTIADLATYTSSSSNVIDLGVINNNSNNNNFADIVAPGFSACDADGYLTMRTPADLFAVDLFTGDTEELQSDVTGSPFNDGGLQVGYFIQNNHIIGDIGVTDEKLLALIDGNRQMHLLPITLTGSNININFNNATISNEGILYLTGGSTGYILKIDVNPASETYLTEVGRPSISAFSTADFAINPVDGNIYGLRTNGQIAMFNPINGARSNSRTVNKVIANGVTRNYNTNHFTSGYGAIYFDQAGNMYAVNNGKYTPPSPSIFGPVLQIPIGDGSATTYTGTIVSDLGFMMTTNDGARCRYAPLGLDFGDAPDSYFTSNSVAGPFHVTRQNSVWLGDKKPDNDVDGVPSINADSDDLGGTTPNDEDAFSNQVRVFINNGMGSLTVPITNNSSEDATLYVWVDFNQSTEFDANERTSIVIPASQTTGTATVNWAGLTTVMTGDTYMRLRICTDSAVASCNTPVGIASNGEVEDHLAKVIEGVFPNTTCDGLYQTDSQASTSINFRNITTTSLPFIATDIITNTTGFDHLNAIAFDRVGGVFYGVYIDNVNLLHVVMFDKQGNIVDIGAPTANADFNIINVQTGAVTTVIEGLPITVSPTLMGELGTISNDGQYLYIGHPSSGQILAVNTNTFKVDAVNLLLPDIGMTSGGGLNLPFDNDWLMDADSGNIVTTEVSARTLYSINPQSGAISATAIDFGTTPPDAKTYGMAQGEGYLIYFVIDGDYDSDLNGSLDASGKALYQLNLKSKKALLMGSITGGESSFSDASGCLLHARDFGDAAITYGEVSHYYFDGNDNGVVDYQLGSQWDSEFFAFTSNDARDDNLYTLIDEDGVVTADVLEAGSNDLMVTASQAGVINIWLDYQNGGTFDVSEQLATNVAISAGSNTVSINLDATAMGSYNGLTTLRVRFCAAIGQCDQFNDTVQGHIAANGEVEDYQVWTTAIPLITESCDSATLSHGSESSFSLAAIQPAVQPFATTILQQPVVISGLPSINSVNALGIHPTNYQIYGVVMDTSSPDRNIHLFVTDQSGTDIIDLGTIVSSQNQILTHATVGTVSFIKNQLLTRNVGALNIQSASRGAIDPSGEYLYLHHAEWHQLIKVHLRDRIFTIVEMDIAVNGMGGDFAFAADGYLYNPDITTSTLYKMNVTTGSVVATSLNWNGISPPTNNGGTGAVFMDTGIFMYAISNNGTHDLDRDGTPEYDGSTMYRLNTLTADIVPVAAMANDYPSSLDGTGCFDSADYGDSTYVNDGLAGHRFYDNDADGVADYRLGTLFDVDLTQPQTQTALGDDLLDIDDEDGVDMPASIVVNSIVNVDVTVSNQASGSLKLNAWVDMNGNGSYHETGEQVVNEVDVVDGVNAIQLILPAAFTQGYNGNTTIRFRLCAQANQCNAPDDTQLGMLAPNGEVEDYPFELINQIVIKGFVFNDNAAGGATAHDGVMALTEAGLASFTIEAIYQGAAITGYNSGDLVARTRSRGDGSYEILLPVEVATQPVIIQVIGQAAWIDISESDLTAISQASSSSVTDNQIAVTANAGDNVEYLNFGKVKPPILEADNFTEVEPNKFVFLRHQLKTFTSGNITLEVNNTTISPPNTGWSIQLYRDNNCNGSIDSGDNAIVAPIATTAVTTFCVLSKVFVPNNASLNAVVNYDVKATMIFEDNAGVGHGVTRIVTDTDTVKVTFAGAGELKLTKTVNNLTQATGKTTQNNAKPNDVLRYEVYFENVGTGDISDVSIFDDTPAYTSLDQILDCANYTYPSTLNCNVVTEHGSNIIGYQGQIRIEFDGVLQPTESGLIYYQVRIE
ncbi:hypothetical protein CTM75_03910 [Photobacterium phosphoreum]|nr:hypothetical protein CTM75_03910 [Photobacterium phosphoreum]